MFCLGKKKKKKISHGIWITSSVNYYAVSDVSSPIASDVPFWHFSIGGGLFYFILLLLLFFSNITSQVVIFFNHMNY